jgi:general secretion pathway protein G
LSFDGGCAILSQYFDTESGFMKHRQSGFTLIELMIVISIIAVLATLGVTNFSAATRRARDSVRKSDVSAISQALVLRRSDHGSYPPQNAAGAMTDAVRDSLQPTYIRELPIDPMTGTRYFYRADAAGRRFALCARLEMASGNYNGTGITITNGRCATTGGNCNPTSLEVNAGATSRNANNAGCCYCVFSP